MKISEILALREQKSKAPDAGGNTPGKQPSPNGKKTITVLRTRETPNPNALQFVLNTQILAYGKRSFSSLEECDGDAMSTAIFRRSGVRNVYIMDNFVTVTKAEGSSWPALQSQVWKSIEDHAAIYPATKDPEKTSAVKVTQFMSLPHDQKLEAVEMVLNRSIRHSLAQDGGGVELKGIEGNEVSILYQGACGNCPSSTTGTLQHIERLIKQQLHKDLVVKPV